jgi:hypothetical protein
VNNLLFFQIAWHWEVDSRHISRRSMKFRSRQSTVDEEVHVDCRLSGTGLSDTSLIIMDGHGSHATNEWMAFCFLNNIYCCYFPAHCSHGMQPLDNGLFNAVNAAY